MTEPSNPEPYRLYRYFDDEDRLLYVGITGDLATRDGSHISRSRWMQLTARSAVERHKTLEDVKKFEREAIETECPLFNIQYNDTPEAKERLHAYLEEIARMDLLYAPPPPPANSTLPLLRDRQAEESDEGGLQESMPEDDPPRPREGCGAAHTALEMLDCQQCRDDFLVAAIPPHGDGIARIAARAREGRACSPDWGSIDLMVFGKCLWCNPLVMDGYEQKLTCHSCGVELELAHHEWFGEDVYMMKYEPLDGHTHLRSCRGRMTGGLHCDHEDPRDQPRPSRRWD